MIDRVTNLFLILLPTFQDIKETDISGVCMTHYNATVEGSVVTIDKVKDLATCTQRPDLTFIPSTGYISDSPVQSLPIFKSSSKCHQRVEEGLLKTAECEETHVFRPFSSEKGGAVTTAKTTMILMSQERLTPITGMCIFVCHLFYRSSLLSTCTKHEEHRHCSFLCLSWFSLQTLTSSAIHWLSSTH